MIRDRLLVRTPGDAGSIGAARQAKYAGVVAIADVVEWKNRFVTVVVLAGIPGSGKSTLATQLAAALAIPMISKDVIKEALMDALGSGELQWVNKLSRASHLVMYDLVRTFATDVLIEAHFHGGVAEADLHALGLPLVQVFCRCPVAVAWDRYQKRRDDPLRHRGHRLEHQDESATLSWRTSDPRPLDLDGPLVEVDTATSVDIESLANVVRPLLAIGNNHSDRTRRTVAGLASPAYTANDDICTH